MIISPDDCFVNDEQRYLKGDFRIGEFDGFKLDGIFVEEVDDYPWDVGRSLEGSWTVPEIEARVLETGQTFENGGAPTPLAPHGLRCVPDEEQGLYWLRRVVVDWGLQDRVIPRYAWRDCTREVQLAFTSPEPEETGSEEKKA